MQGKKIGEACPKCAGNLIRRAKRIVARDGGPGDVAFCPRCNGAWEIEEAVERVAFPRALPA